MRVDLPSPLRNPADHAGPAPLLAPHGDDPLDAPLLVPPGALAREECPALLPLKQMERRVHFFAVESAHIPKDVAKVDHQNASHLLVHCAHTKHRPIAHVNIASPAFARAMHS